MFQASFLVFVASLAQGVGPPKSLLHFHGASPTSMKLSLSWARYFFNKRRLNECIFGSRAN